MREERITVDDGCTLWTVREGSGPPLVLCHGGPGMWDYLAPLSALLRDRATVLRWDQRGCGRSGQRGPFTFARFVADLDAIRAHFGYDRWIVGGHSWGATLALEYALVHPERTAALLYLSGTGLEWPRFRAAYRDERLRRLGPERAARLAELEARERDAAEEREFLRLSWCTDCIDPIEGERVADAMLDDGLAVNFACNAALNAENSARDSAAELARCHDLDVPVLVLHGSGDTRPAGAVTSLVAALPNARLTVLDGAGHLPWVEQQEATAAAMRAFLDEVQAAEE